MKNLLGFRILQFENYYNEKINFLKPLIIKIEPGETPPSLNLSKIIEKESQDSIRCKNLNFNLRKYFCKFI